MRRTPGRWLVPLALTLVGLASEGCTAARLYAKDLMDPRESAVVTVPVKVAAVLFVIPPAIAWLPVSILPLLLLRDEGAIWFALAPGLVVGGPIVFLAGAPGYLLTDRPGEETAPVRSGTAAVSSR